MTKTIKLSLAAVMAAGIATSASAANLEDAIKGVEVSGYVDYRKETIGSNKAAYSDVNEYSVNVTLTSKVNDMVKATVSAGFDEVVTNNTTGADTSAPVGVDQAYFTFDTGFATVMAGKQNIPSVFVDQSDTVAQGPGIVALKPINDALTIAVAHFWQTNLGVDGTAASTTAYTTSVTEFDDNNATAATATTTATTTAGASTDVKTTELVAMGKAGMVNYEGHYNMTSVKVTPATTVELKGLFLKAGADINGVKVFGQTASMSSDAANTKDGKVMILGVSGNAGAVSLDAKYFTGKDNNSVDVSLNADNDSQVHAKVWQASTAKSVDMTGIALTAGTKIGPVDAKLVYASASDDRSATVTKDYTEIMPMVTYKMSKNFSLHARYSMLNVKETNVATDTKQNKSRIQVKYTF